MLIRVHRRIVLMTESYCIARLAIAVGLRTLPADRPQFVTLQLSLAAGQASRCVSWFDSCDRVMFTHQPVRDRLPTIPT